MHELGNTFRTAEKDLTLFDSLTCRLGGEDSAADNF